MSNYSNHVRWYLSNSFPLGCVLQFIWIHNLRIFTDVCQQDYNCLLLVLAALHPTLQTIILMIKAPALEYATIDIISLCVKTVFVVIVAAFHIKFFKNRVTFVSIWKNIDYVDKSLPSSGFRVPHSTNTRICATSLLVSIPNHIVVAYHQIRNWVITNRTQSTVSFVLDIITYFSVLFSVNNVVF